MGMKKRILVIGPGMEIGGVERSLIALLNSFDYDNVEVDLFLFAHKGEFMPFLHPKVRLLPENKKFSYISQPIMSLVKRGHVLAAMVRLYAKAVGFLRSKITKRSSVNTHLCNKIFTCFSKPLPYEYDLALGFFGPHFFLNKKVKAAKKIGWVHTDYSNRSENLDSSFIYSSWSALDQIACVSESVRDSFASLFPQLESKMIVVENILDPNFIRAQAKAENVLSEMPQDGSFRILSVGRFCTAKAFDEAIRASKALRENGYPVKWYFIGYGPDEEELRNLIKEQKSEEYTVILGKKTNPYPYMLACDLYAQPSRYEGKAVTVQEAQILGKPVLITNFKTAKSQLTDGYDGYICPMGVEGVVSGVCYLIENPDLRKSLAEHCGVRKNRKAGIDSEELRELLR